MPSTKRTPENGALMVGDSASHAYVPTTASLAPLATSKPRHAKKKASIGYTDPSNGWIAPFGALVACGCLIHNTAS